MPMRQITALAAVALLAACQQEPAPAEQPGDSPAQPAAAGGEAAGEAAADAPAPAPDEPAVIPAAFRGLWAATEADCTAPAESRLEIGAERLTFYESTGDVASVEQTGADEILITVPLTGEGTSSVRTYRYRLLDDGAALFDVRSGFTRRRCPTA